MTSRNLFKTRKFYCSIIIIIINVCKAEHLQKQSHILLVLLNQKNVFRCSKCILYENVLKSCKFHICKARVFASKSIMNLLTNLSAKSLQKPFLKRRREGAKLLTELSQVVIIFCKRYLLRVCHVLWCRIFFPYFDSINDNNWSVPPTFVERCSSWHQSL